MRISDWSSDVCSSDLIADGAHRHRAAAQHDDALAGAGVVDLAGCRSLRSRTAEHLAGGRLESGRLHAAALGADTVDDHFLAGLHSEVAAQRDARRVGGLDDRQSYG